MASSTVDAPDWSQIPAPVDDGETSHLLGRRMPAIALPGTGGSTVDMSGLAGRTVVYAYPRTGRPGVENPDGWDMPARAAVRPRAARSGIISRS